VCQARSACKNGSWASRGAFDLLATRGGAQLGIQVQRSPLPLRFTQEEWSRLEAEARRLHWHWVLAAEGADGSWPATGVPRQTAWRSCGGPDTAGHLCEAGRAPSAHIQGGRQEGGTADETLHLVLEEQRQAPVRGEQKALQGVLQISLHRRARRLHQRVPQELQVEGMTADDVDGLRGDLHMLDPARATKGREVRVGSAGVIENLLLWLDRKKR
jgi:hypothetical protein